MGDAIVWYISRDNKEYGPFNRDDFERFEREHQLISIDLIWHTGLTDWIKYRDYLQKSNQNEEAVAPLPISRVAAFLALLRTAIRVPIYLAKTAYSLITRPTSFGRDRIDRKPGDLQRAITFFLNMFAIIFLSFSALGAYYGGFGGASEARMLAESALLIAIILLIVYLLNKATRQPVNFAGVAQAALYADALFFIAAIPVIALIAYITPSPATGRGELDIIATEYEKCVTGQSTLYWLMRGDLQFYIRPAVTLFTGTIELVKEYFQYIISVPFCILFARLLRGRYGASALLNTVFAISAVITVNLVWQVGLEKVLEYMRTNTTCATTFFEQASTKYSPQLLGKQIAYNINQQLARSNYPPNAVRVAGEKFVMDLAMKPTAIKTRESMESFRRLGIAFYCEDYTAFRYARQLNIPLHYIVRRHDGLIIINEEVTPAQCAKK